MREYLTLGQCFQSSYIVKIEIFISMNSVSHIHLFVEPAFLKFLFKLPGDCELHVINTHMYREYILQRK